MYPKKPMEGGDFRKIIEDLSRTKSSPVTVFSDFVRMAACAVACQTREEEYLETAGRYSRDELEGIAKAFACLVSEMQTNPYTDLLGEYYQTVQSKSGRDSKGEFFTPPEISSMIARISVDVDAVLSEGKPITINEPASGSGGIILKVAELFAPTDKGSPSHIDLLRVTAQDISPVSCDMCYVNTTLWGIPAKIIWGNTLAREQKKVWKNLHWIRVGEDGRQALQSAFQLLTDPPEQPTGDAGKAENPLPPSFDPPTTQMELF